MNTSEAIEAIKGLKIKWFSHYPIIHQVADVFAEIGYTAQMEQRVETCVMKGSRKGRIDLVLVKRGSPTIAIEVDNGTPRERSVWKLRAHGAEIKLVVVRKHVLPPCPEGIDAVVRLGHPDGLFKPAVSYPTGQFHGQPIDEVKAIRRWQRRRRKKSRNDLRREARGTGRDARRAEGRAAEKLVLHQVFEPKLKKDGLDEIIAGL